MPEVARCPDGHYWRVTTPNKLFCRALYKGGAQSMSLFFQSISLFHWFLRCTAPQLNLNQTEGVTCWCQDHTELLVHELELGNLWDGWGIVGNVVVRLLLHIFSSLFCSYCCASPTFYQCSLYNTTYAIVPTASQLHYLQSLPRWCLAVTQVAHLRLPRHLSKCRGDISMSITVV